MARSDDSNRLALDETLRAIDERIAALDFTDELNAAGVPWYTADADGTVVTHQPPSRGPAS